MKKLYFFMLAMMAVIAANATTVYFENTGNWPKVNAYAWEPNNASWPGVEVTEQVTVTVQGSSETKTLYKYELPGAQANIIFNGEGGQTQDLPVADGSVFSFAVNSTSKYPIGTVSGTTFIPAGAVEITYGKIYVPYKMFDRQTAYIYSWNKSLFGGWPGQEMIKVTENGIDFWMVEVDETDLPATVEGWLLTEGNGKPQSENLVGVTFQKDYVYDLDGTSTPLADYRLPEGDKIVYNIRGTIFGDTDWKDYALTEEDGVWSYTGNAVPGDFGIAKIVNGSQQAWYFTDAEHQNITAPGEFPVLSENGVNWANKLTGELTFKFDPEAMTLTVEQSTDVPEVKWYVSYNINDAGWVFNQEMTEDSAAEGVYYAEFSMTADTNYFTFANAPMNDWKVEEGGTRFGCEGDNDVEIEVDKTYNLKAGSEKCFTAASGNARIFLNTNDMTIKCTGKLSTMLTTINADSNVAAEYFNLQGVRIANPVAGQLVIERRGSVVAKRVF